MAKSKGYTMIGDRSTEHAELEELEDLAYLEKPKTSRYRLPVWWTYVLVALISASVGTSLPRAWSAVRDTGFLLAPAGEVSEVWHYNRTFSSSPTPETEDAWRAIFPLGRGFFSHPQLEANISGIAVFHELHCLHGIRAAYYTAINQSQHAHGSSSFIDPHDPDAHVDAANAHNNPHHIRHCFDYLRRALMCAADTNIEEIDWKAGGSTGWGFERKCRDYSAVVRWAEKWRANSQDQIE